jgi:hypothetical protein
MAAEKRLSDNKSKDWDEEHRKNLDTANNWISRYRSSGYSRKILSECEMMTLNQVALITKLINIESESKNNRVPETFYFVWQKSYTAFYEKIGWRVQDMDSHITHIDSFLDDEYSFYSMNEIIDKWIPESKAPFEDYVINYRLPKYFKDRKSYIEFIDKIRKYHASRLDPGKGKSKYDGYKPILYTVFLEIDELPHKVLIFLYLALNYSSNINFRLKQFFNEKFSCQLKELYEDIDEQYLGRKLNKVFEEKYGEYLLKLPVGSLYKSEDYKEMIVLSGPDKIIEDLIISIFFWYHYKNYPDNPDFVSIRNVISKWNSRFKEEAEALLRDKKRKMGS